MQRLLLEALVNTTGLRTTKLGGGEAHSHMLALHNDPGDHEQLRRYIGSENPDARQQHMPEVWNHRAQGWVSRNKPLSDVSNAIQKGITADNAHNYRGMLPERQRRQHELPPEVSAKRVNELVAPYRDKAAKGARAFKKQYGKNPDAIAALRKYLAHNVPKRIK